jgi:hypothetical protein
MQASIRPLYCKNAMGEHAPINLSTTKSKPLPEQHPIRVSFFSIGDFRCLMGREKPYEKMTISAAHQGPDGGYSFTVNSNPDDVKCWLFVDNT